MGRDYGSLSSSRRGQSAGWQWFVFGAITGIIATGCVVATLLVTIAFEVVTVPGVAIGPSPQPEIEFRVVTSTPDPNAQPSPAPATQQPAATQPDAAAPTDAQAQAQPTETTVGSVGLPTSTPAPLDIDSPPVGENGGAETGGEVTGSVAVAPSPTSAVTLPNDLIEGGDEGGNRHGRSATSPARHGIRGTEQRGQQRRRRPARARIQRATGQRLTGSATAGPVQHHADSHRG